MTSREADGPLEIHFRIDDRRGCTQSSRYFSSVEIAHTAAQCGGLQRLGPPHRTERWFEHWPEMLQLVQYLSEAASASYAAHRPSSAYLLVPLQHYVQRRGPILEALYRISGNFWFSPSELVMTSLLQFEEKVHRKDLARAESIPRTNARLLCYVLEQMRFPEEPRIEMRDRCPHVVSMDRVMTMPVHFHIRPQDQEEVPGQEAEDAHTDMPAPEPEVQRTSHSHFRSFTSISSHILLQLRPLQILPAFLFRAHHSPEYTHVSSREDS